MENESDLESGRTVCTIRQRERRDIKDASFFELMCELCSRIWNRFRSIQRFLFAQICGSWCGCKFPRSRGSSGTNVDEDFQLLVPEQTELKHLQDKFEALQLQYEELWSENQKLKSRIEGQSGENYMFITRLDDMKRRHDQEIDNLNFNHSRRESALMTEKDELKRSKDEALSRLSDLMGAKLRDNNPAITDLNDPNRPMKLGDQFSELYENDWTDAFIELTEIKSEDGTKTFNEEAAISVLLNLLKEIDDTCAETSRTQLAGMIQSTENFSRDEASDYLKAVKDAHKTNALKFLPLIIQQLTSEKSTCQTVVTYISTDECRRFIENCIKFCYLSAVQDPPMFLSFDAGEYFDRQVYKEYTATGTNVKFLVWPALFLHRGGPLISKGVVQPIAADVQSKEIDMQSKDDDKQFKDDKQSRDADLQQKGGDVQSKDDDKQINDDRQSGDADGQSKGGDVQSKDNDVQPKDSGMQPKDGVQSQDADWQSRDAGVQHEATDWQSKDADMQSSDIELYENADRQSKDDDLQSKDADGQSNDDRVESKRSDGQPEAADRRVDNQSEVDGDRTEATDTKLQANVEQSKSTEEPPVNADMEAADK